MPNLPPTDDHLARSPELMNAADSALLVIDMQQRLLKVMPAADRVVWNARRLVDGAALLGVPIAWTEQNPEKLGGTTPLLAERLTVAGAEGPVAKLAFSCGQHAAITRKWHGTGHRRVLLIGVETHVCVLQTALDYVADGFDVFIAVDAVASRHTVDHETALRRLEASGVTLTTTETALCEWTEAAGTPLFKQVSALLKEQEPAS